jgi:abortive infection bacteriophage resistance protein
VPSKDALVNVLKHISYYRLSGYIFSFKEPNSENYLPGTTLSSVLDRYYFDDNLRKITFNALTDVEIQLRNDILHAHTKKYGPFGYLCHMSLPNMTHSEHCCFLSSMCRNKTRSKELFIVSYNTNYTDSNALPLWMALETSTFGELLYFHLGLDGDVKNSIADMYFLPKQVFRSWVLSLGYIRNVCTHHCRLWDKNLSMKPCRRERRSEWIRPDLVDTSTFYALALVLLHFQQHISSIRWKEEFLDLVRTNPRIPVCERMGFPIDWQNLSMWR